MAENGKKLSYVSGHHESVLKYHGSRTAQDNCAYFLPYLKNPSAHILDVGCGPGSISLDFARLVPHGQVTGVDFSEVAVHSAIKAAEDQGIKNTTFQTGDATKLDFADATFDVVHAHQVLIHLQNPLEALKEMKRVTKPGGFVAVRDAIMCATTWYPPMEGLDTSKKLLHDLSVANGNDDSIGRRLLSLAQQAGWGGQQIKASVGTWLWSTPEERQFYGKSFQDRALKTDFGKNVIKNSVGTQDDLDMMAKGWADFASSEDGWMVLLHGEIVCFVPEGA